MLPQTLDTVVMLWTFHGSCNVTAAHVLLVCSLPDGLNSKCCHGTTCLLAGGVLTMSGKTDGIVPQQLLNLPECRMTH